MTRHPLADTPPMEARLVEALPTEPGWQFEPKWDGFRAIVSRNGTAVAIMSKSGKPLDRYFPELVARIAAMRAERFVVDGEIVVVTRDALSFDALQARLHPAASRIERLARETAAQLILFDCLSLAERGLIDRPLHERRAVLDGFHAREGDAMLRLSPATQELAQAREWLRRSGGALDGVIAKRCDAAYQPGERAMLKVKPIRTADCVVGGFRRERDGPLVASLLLGLYDDAGLLDHVGFTSAIARADKPELTGRLEALVGGEGFTGKAPGGTSRWTNGRESAWVPLKSELVVEVGYDQVTSRRFRHGTRLLRWRPDKAPEQCTMDQLAPPLRPSQVAALFGDER